MKAVQKAAPAAIPWLGADADHDQQDGCEECEATHGMTL
jgi:hypothetical protein